MFVSHNISYPYGSDKNNGETTTEIPNSATSKETCRALIFVKAVNFDDTKTSSGNGNYSINPSKFRVLSKKQINQLEGGPESNWLCLIIWPVVYTSNSAIFTCYIWDISHIWWEIKGYTVYIPMFSSFLVRLQFRAMLFCRTLRAWAAHNLVLRASVLHLQKMATHFFWVLLGPTKSLTISCGWIIWT